MFVWTEVVTIVKAGVTGKGFTVGTLQNWGTTW